MTSASLMHEARHPERVLLDNSEGWGGEGGGSRVKMVGHMYTHGWFMLMYGENHSIVK